MERAPTTSENGLQMSKGRNLKIKLNKCQFFKTYLHCQGHLMSEQGIRPQPENVTAMEKLKDPHNIKELFHFLGLTRLLQEIHTIIFM